MCSVRVIGRDGSVYVCVRVCVVQCKDVRGRVRNKAIVV